MAKRGKRKLSSRPEDWEKKIEQSTEMGAQTMLTAATITLMETWGWPEEWIVEWTKRTLATALLLVENLIPDHQTIETILPLMGRSEQTDQLVEVLNQFRLQQDPEKESQNKPTESLVTLTD